jgi:hypothetical protein
MVAAVGFLIPAPPLHLHVSTNPPLPCPPARRPTSRFHTCRWPQTWPCLQRSHRRALVLLAARPWPLPHRLAGGGGSSQDAATPDASTAELTAPLLHGIRAQRRCGGSPAPTTVLRYSTVRSQMLLHGMADGYTPVRILPYSLLGALARGITVPRGWMTLFIRCTDTASNMVYV